MKGDNTNTNGEDNQQRQIYEGQPVPTQHKLSRRVLLIGGLGTLAAGSILATIISAKLSPPPPSYHPFLTIPSKRYSVQTPLFWSPDGKRIAICHSDGVRILDGQSGHQLWTYQPALLKGFDSTALLLIWSLDGSYLYYVNNTTLYVLDADSGKLLWIDNLILHGYNVSTAIRLAWSSDGSHCAVGPATRTTPTGEDIVVFIWNIAERKLSAVCSLPVTSRSSDRLKQLAWSLDGSQLASIDANGNTLV